MALKYPPKRAQVILCDFSKGGFKPPEMVKRRPCVILADRLPHRDGLANVVPLSGTPPPHSTCDYQCQITFEEYLPAPFDGNLDWWVKADMITTVSYDRLDLFRTGRDQSNKRKYYAAKLTKEQFEAVQETVQRALRFS